VIQEYYLKRFGARSTMIAYGTDSTGVETTETQQRLGVPQRGYALYVSRLEPENNAHLVIEAYRQVRTLAPLLIVGDAPYAGDYIARLKASADERTRFTGGIYGQGYRELQSHALLYIHATEVGGTHPALVEGMGHGNCVIVYDAPENREVAGDCALYFNDVESLARQIQRAIDDPVLVADLRVKARSRAQQLFSWDAIADQYERLFEEMTHRRN
jgi:glycosyltransferase involved in cell wall biosynthesis